MQTGLGHVWAALCLSLCTHTASACNPAPAAPARPEGLLGTLAEVRPPLVPDPACGMRYAAQLDSMLFVEQAAQWMAEPWQSQAAYRRGSLVSHEGRLWRARWYSQAEPPPATVWQGISAFAGVLPWSDQETYHGGDVAHWEGEIYQAQWYSHADDPASAPVWRKTGDQLQGGDGKLPQSAALTLKRLPDGRLQVQVSVLYSVTPHIRYMVGAQCQMAVHHIRVEYNPSYRNGVQEWRIYLQGKLLQSAALVPQSLPPSTPPMTPRPIPVRALPDGSCQPALGSVLGDSYGPTSYTRWQGEVILDAQASENAWLSVSACNGGLCNSSALIHTGLLGKAQP